MQTFGTTPLSFIVWDRPKAAQPTFADIFGTGVVWSKHWRWGQVDSSLDLSMFLEIPASPDRCVDAIRDRNIVLYQSEKFYVGDVVG